MTGPEKTTFHPDNFPAVAIICFYRKWWLTFLRGRHLAHGNASNLQMILKLSPGHLYYNYITAKAIQLFYTADDGG